MSEGLSVTRLYEIDLIKVFAVIVMIYLHICMVMTASFYDKEGPLLYVTDFIGRPLAGCVFMFAMGVGMVYTRHNRPIDFFRRGIILMSIGYLLNFLREVLPLVLFGQVGSDYDTLEIALLNVDILIFAGAAFMSVGLLKCLKIGKWHILMIAVILSIIGTAIQSVGLGFDSDILNCLFGVFVPTKSGMENFALSQWLIFPVAGIVFGSLIKNTKDTNLFYKKVAVMSLIVFAIITLGYALAGKNIFLESVVKDDGYYFMNLISVAWNLSIVLMWTVLWKCLSPLVIKSGKLFSFVKYSAKNVNPLYIIQWIIICWASIIWYDLVKEDVFMDYLLPITVLFIIVTFLVSVPYVKLRDALKARMSENHSEF